MTSEKPSRSSQKKLTVASVVIALGILLSGVFLSRSSEDNDLLVVSPAELRRNIFDFIANKLVVDKSLANFQLLETVECHSDGSCAGTTASSNPTYAWTLLFLARAKVEYVHSDPERHKIASGLLDIVFNGWVRTLNLNNEKFSLHQLYEAGKATGDDRFLFWVRDRFYSSLEHGKGLVRYFNSSGISKSNSFLVSTLARQLALGLQATLEHTPSPEPPLFSSPSKDLDNRGLLIKDTMETMARLLEIAAVEAKQGDDSSYPALNLSGQDPDKIPQMICFQVWAKTAVFKLRPNLSNDEWKLVPTKEDELNVFFNRLQQLLNSGNANFIYLQSLLPCVHALNDYREYLALEHKGCSDNKDCSTPLEWYRNTQENLEGLYLELLKIALGSWDSPKTNSPCAKLGGFISDVPTNQLKCNGTYSIVDNSWLAYILKPDSDWLTLYAKVAVK